jgi:hypothetical protein
MSILGVYINSVQKISIQCEMCTSFLKTEYRKGNNVNFGDILV